MSDNFFHIAARASAGTGKTYSLVENYVAALLGTDPSGIKKRPEQILALTFTQKAANEMRLRVAKRLLELLAEENELDKDELKRLLRALPNATIATFHGFCASLLRKEARAIGINDQFEMLLPNEERRLAKNIMRPLIMAQIEQKSALMSSLVARFRLGEGLLSLGLITGLLECYFRIAELGIVQEQLQKPKLPLSLDPLYQDLEHLRAALAAFKALKSSPSTQERLIGIERAIECIGLELGAMNEAALASSWTRLRQAVKGNFGDITARQTLSSAVLRLGAHLVDYFVDFDEHFLSKLMSSFHSQFEIEKRKRNKFSYADLLLYVRTALGENLELRKRVKQRFLHILVDEYQDTSPIQEQIIALIAENKAIQQELAKACDPLKHLDFKNGTSLFVVGDKKQSIYGFRGADTNLFDRMIQKMAQTHEAEGFGQKLLTINRRSKSELLKLVNLVSCHTLHNYSQQEDLEPWHGGEPGKAALWVSDDDKDLDKSSANALACTQGIAQLLAQRPDLRPSDIVILVRRIRSAIVIKEQLAKRQIASRIVGGDGFFQRQEVIDLIAALKLINDPGHELATAIVVRSPLVLVPDAWLLNFTNNEQKLNFCTISALLANNKEEGDWVTRLTCFSQTLSDIKAELVQKGLPWALDLLIARTDFAYALGLSDNAEQALSNVHKLRSMLGVPTQNPAVLIEEYFDQIFNNLKEPQALGLHADHMLTIMTIHQSKGLEFKVVVLADGESSLPPHQSDFLYDQALGLVVKAKARPIAACAPSGDEKEHIKTRFDCARQRLQHLEQRELARLLYVALTRAREELYVVCSKTSFNSEGNTKSLVGLFLSALKHERHDFLALCPVVNIKMAETEPARSFISNLPTNSNFVIYEAREPKTRWFSSQLVAPSQWESSITIEDPGRSPRGIDGNLAHQILSQAGTMLLGFSNHDPQVLQHLLHASLRAQPVYSNVSKAELTKTACENTLRVLSSELKEAIRATFEMPLYTWATKNILVEGFADLVVENSAFVGVVEFKSSLRLATHPNSYLQIFAYAESLLERVDKPVKYAILLVGSSKAIRWRDYDANCQKAFHIAMGAQMLC